MKQNEISQKQSEKAKILRRRYSIILNVLPNKAIKYFQLRGTLKEPKQSYCNQRVQLPPETNLPTHRNMPNRSGHLPSYCHERRQHGQEKTYVGLPEGTFKTNNATTSALAETQNVSMPLSLANMFGTEK